MISQIPNKWFLRYRLNCPKLEFCRRLIGKLFHKRGTATAIAKLLSPNLLWIRELFAHGKCTLDSDCIKALNYCYYYYFLPTSTKPQAWKLKLRKIKNGCTVQRRFHSVTIVWWNEIAFPLWRAMNRRWKRNVVSLMSSVIVVMRLTISCVSSMAMLCRVPAVSMANE